jgi:hypothetical protein
MPFMPPIKKGNNMKIEYHVIVISEIIKIAQFLFLNDYDKQTEYAKLLSMRILGHSFEDPRMFPDIARNTEKQEAVLSLMRRAGMAVSRREFARMPGANSLMSSFDRMCKSGDLRQVTDSGHKRAGRPAVRWVIENSMPAPAPVEPESTPRSPKLRPLDAFMALSDAEVDALIGTETHNERNYVRTLAKTISCDKEYLICALTENRAACAAVTNPTAR